MSLLQWQQAGTVTLAADPTAASWDNSGTISGAGLVPFEKVSLKAANLYQFSLAQQGVVEIFDSSGFLLENFSSQFRPDADGIYYLQPVVIGTSNFTLTVHEDVGGDGINNHLSGTPPVTVAGTGTLHQPGDQSVSVTLNAGDTLQAGSGNDTVLFANAGGNLINLGGGADSLSGSGANDTISGGDGNDSFASSGGLLASSVILGSGKDAVTLFTASGATVGASFSGLTLSAGAGADTILVAATLGNAQISLGNGNDSLNFFTSVGSPFPASFSALTIGVGSGNDTVVFSSSLAASSISLGGGNDSLEFFTPSGRSTTNLSNVTINAGAGADTIQFLGSTTGNPVINQPTGAAATIFDFTGSPNMAPTVTVTNVGDVIVSPPAGLAVNVAVDGYKPPYSSAVQYVATSEAIAAPYNIAQPLPYFVSNLVVDPVQHWTSTIGVHAVAPRLTFSFMQTLPTGATAQDAAGFAALGPDLPASVIGFSPQQILDANAAHAISLNDVELQAVTVLANWQAVANVNLVAAADTSGISIRVGGNIEDVSIAGYAYPPTAAEGYIRSSTGQDGNVYLNIAEFSANYFATGQFGGTLLAHEFGHSLGLGGESGSNDSHDTLPGGAGSLPGGIAHPEGNEPSNTEDNLANTVMTHNNFRVNGVFPNSPQAFDIAAIQYIYGPNPAYHPNSSHLWGFNPGGGAANLVSDGAGFTDTISAATATQNAFIDLRSGHWDWLGAPSSDILAGNQLMIDYGTQVQVAIGGSGNDTLIGNDANDSLAGGAGDDLLVVGPGNDTLDGGTGTNTALFADPSADYAIVGSGSSVTVTETVAGRQGSDVLANVQRLQFSDVTELLVSAGATGTAGNDLLISTGPNDVVFTGEGNDSISIGGGSDLIVEGAFGTPPVSAENDTLSAGNGSSTIWGGAGSGTITVGDGNDLMALHLPGLTSYGNTVVHLGNGRDTVLAVGGNDTVFGGGGLDLIAGGSGSMSIVGGSGTTVMSGGTLASTLTGGTGATEIISTSGQDSITAGSGGSTILGAGTNAAAGGDTIRAGLGNDAIIMGSGSESLFANLGGGKVSVLVGGFSAAGQTKALALGSGADSLILTDTVSAALAGSETVNITGYKPGVDHFTLQGLAERSFAALAMSTAGGNTNIVLPDLGTIVLVGVAAGKIGSGDFSFA